MVMFLEVGNEAKVVSLQSEATPVFEIFLLFTVEATADMLQYFE